MEQATLDAYSTSVDVDDGLLEYANAFQFAREKRIPPKEQYRTAWKERARSRGFCPNCWLEAHSHVRMDVCHIDDVDRHVTPECDKNAHARAETYLRDK